MKRNHLLVIIGVIVMATLACNFSVNIPVRRVTVGSLETYSIDVPPPSEGDDISEVSLEFGAGELFLNRGSGESLVSGIATYNVEEFKPVITVNGTGVEITQRLMDSNIIPAIDEEMVNKWELELGTMPLELNISAGGYQGRFELGGLALRKVHISEGASDTQLSFSESNQVEMDSLRYETGASKATLSGLSNANFNSFEFRSGAGDYRLDFSGELLRDGDVSIKSGLSNVVIVVPEGTAATVQVEGGLTNIDLSGEWRSSGNEYIQDGDGPMLTITVEMGAGNLEFRNH